MKKVVITCLTKSYRVACLGVDLVKGQEIDVLEEVVAKHLPALIGDANMKAISIKYETVCREQRVGEETPVPQVPVAHKPVGNLRPVTKKETNTKAPARQAEKPKMAVPKKKSR